MKKKGPLACTECGQRNYSIDPSTTRTTRLEMKKYCPKCKRHTLHKQTV